MPISVRCTCGRSYQVAAKHAGRSFRCKSCDERVTVPRAGGPRGASARGDRAAPQSAGGYDLYEDESHRTEDYESDDYGHFESPRPRRKRRPETRRRRPRAEGMPATVIVAIVGEGLLIPLNLLSALGNLIVLNLCALFFCLLRIGFEIACIIGFVKRQSQARWTSITLSALGIVVFGLIVALLMGKNNVLVKQIPDDIRNFSIIFALAQIAIFCLLIGTLVTPSATEHFDS